MSQGGPAGWEEAYELGGPAFVELVRQVHDPEVLAALAGRWSNDPRPNTRNLLRAYLYQPFNAFRHEVLVKRLFKAAEAAGDDDVLAWMMPALDRSLTRQVQLSRRTETAVVPTREEARALAMEWARGGERMTRTWQVGPDQHLVMARGREPGLAVPHGTRMPRDDERSAFVLDPLVHRYVRKAVPEWVLKLGLVDQVGARGELPAPGLRRQELERFQLFSVATRHYLRRRVWRYFRKLAETDPERYTRSVRQALILYRDEDFENGVSLLDRWCLMHVAFGLHPLLEARSNGWVFRESLNESQLEPYPAFESHWETDTESLALIAENAGSQLVRHWALAMLQKQGEQVREVLSFERIQAWLTHEDPVVAATGASWLPAVSGIDQINLKSWRTLINRVDESQLLSLATQIESRVNLRELSLEDAVELARMRPEHLARQGFQLLRERDIASHEWPAVLPVAQSASDPVRAEALAWLQEHLKQAEGLVEVDWVSDWLTCDHANTRAAGLAWFAAEPKAHHNPQIWERVVQRLDPDIVPGLVALLAGSASQGNAARSDLVAELPLCTLLPVWSCVLEADPSGSYRLTERVISQVRRRVESHPEQVEPLVRLLALGVSSHALRVSRSAIVGLTRIRALRPDLASEIGTEVPELQWIA